MSKGATKSYSHDHVILMLDTPEFENPPAWLADNFNIIEGGTHAGKQETPIDIAEGMSSSIHCIGPGGP